MWTVFSLIYSIVLPIGVLFIPKMLVANAIEVGIEGDVTLGRKALNIVPWLNSYLVKKSIDGKAKFYAFMSWYALVTFVALVPARTILVTDVLVQWGMTAWVIVFLGVSYIAEIILLVTLCSLFDKKKLIFTAVVPFFCLALLLPHIKPYFARHKETLDGTFESS